MIIKYFVFFKMVIQRKKCVRMDTSYSPYSSCLYTEDAKACPGQSSTTSLIPAAPNVPIQPDAPGALSVSPVAGRPTPYVTPPSNCWQNLGSGQVVCMANESHGGLYGAGGVVGGGVGGMYPPVGGIDSPLSRILTREPTGPWRLVGYATANDTTGTQSRDRSMMVYSQTVDTRRDKYNYRVVDSNGVPLDIGDTIGWKMDGEVVGVPGQSGDYTLHLYPNFK